VQWPNQQALHHQDQVVQQQKFGLSLVLVQPLGLDSVPL
jgi:hypothetical protein